MGFPAQVSFSSPSPSKNPGPGLESPCTPISRPHPGVSLGWEGGVGAGRRAAACRQSPALPPLEFNSRRHETGGREIRTGVGCPQADVKNDGRQAARLEGSTALGAVGWRWNAAEIAGRGRGLRRRTARDYRQGSARCFRARQRGEDRQPPQPAPKKRARVNDHPGPEGNAKRLPAITAVRRSR